MSFLKYLYFLVSTDGKFAIPSKIDGIIPKELYETESLFTDISLVIVVVSIVLIYVYYSIIGKRTGSFANNKYWGGLLFANTLIVGLFTVFRIRSAYGGNHFDFYLGSTDWKLIISAGLYSIIVYFLLSLVFRSKYLTTHCMYIPFGK